MAATTVANVPGITMAGRVTYKVADTLGTAMLIGQGVAWHTTAGEIISTTVATNGKCAGIVCESCSIVEAAAGYYMSVQIYGVAMVAAGGSSDWTVGDFIVFEGTDGYFCPAGSTSNTLYMTHGVALNQPDTDLDFGFVLLNLNVPYYAATT